MKKEVLLPRKNAERDVSHKQTADNILSIRIDCAERMSNHDSAGLQRDPHQDGWKNVYRTSSRAWRRVEINIGLFSCTS